MQLRRSLLADFEGELLTCCRVAVLQAAGYRRAEIARRLNVGAGELRAAERRVKRAAERMDRGD